MSTDEIPACVSCFLKSASGNFKLVSEDKCQSPLHVAASVVSKGVVAR